MTMAAAWRIIRTTLRSNDSRDHFSFNGSFGKEIFTDYRFVYDRRIDRSLRRLKFHALVSLRS